MTAPKNGCGVSPAWQVNLKSGRSGAESADGSLVVPKSTCPGATSMPVRVMLWQKLQPSRVGLPKFMELRPDESLIRNVRSRKMAAPRATDSRNSRCASLLPAVFVVADAGIVPGVVVADAGLVVAGAAQGEYSTHCTSLELFSTPGFESASVSGPPCAPPSSSLPPTKSTLCAV